MPWNELMRIFPVPETKPPFYLRMAGITYYNASYELTRKYPNNLGCEYIIDGEGEVECGNEKFVARKGDVFILPIGVPHRYRSNPENPWMKIWFCARGTLAQQLPELYGIQKVHHLTDFDCYDIFLKMFNIAMNTKTPLEHMNNQAALLCHEFIQAVALEYSGKSGNISDSENLRRFIEQNAHKTLTLHDMAENAYHSPSQTIRMFRRDFGITPYEYYMTKKLELACTMLRSNRATIKEIAFMLGFSDENYFSKVFRHRKGISPKEYRKKQQKQEPSNP